jgi:hypothetical protein
VCIDLVSGMASLACSGSIMCSSCGESCSEEPCSDDEEYLSVVLVLVDVDATLIFFLKSKEGEEEKKKK